MLMLGANTMAIRSDAAVMARLPASSKPVVPITIFTPAAAHAARCSRVASGRVKSISTSAAASAVEITLNANAGGPPKKLAAIAPERRTVGPFESDGQREVWIGQCAFDQHMAHAPGRAGNREFHRRGPH